MKGTILALSMLIPASLNAMDYIEKDDRAAYVGKLVPDGSRIDVGTQTTNCELDDDLIQLELIVQYNFKVKVSDFYDQFGKIYKVSGQEFIETLGELGRLNYIRKEGYQNCKEESFWGCWLKGDQNTSGISLFNEQLRLPISDSEADVKVRRYAVRKMIEEFYSKKHIYSRISEKVQAMSKNIVSFKDLIVFLDHELREKLQ